MAITNEQVLTKISRELQEALQKKNQSDKVREHARAIRLLCDLILDDTNEERIDSATELKKMMGDTGSVPNKPQSSIGATIQTPQTVNHEEANGKSIFDF